MGDLLSQSAIDDLISQIGSGPDVSLGASAAISTSSYSPVISAGQTVKDVRPYDFARASKFSKDQIRTIQMIHETFARLFSGTLSAKIRSLTKVKVVSVEEVTYEEFINTISNPSIISVISFSPLEGSAVFDINPGIGFPLLERLLGGTGAGDEEPRELTDIEINLTESIINDALNFMKESWSNVVALTPRLEVLESNPFFVQIVSSNEMVALINFEVEIGEKTGRMNMALPYVMLESVLPKLSIQKWFSTYKKKAPSVEPTKQVEERILKTTVNFVVKLGTTYITLKDFLGLDVGDIIQMDTKITDDIDIMVGDKLKFKGKPGSIGKRMAIQTASVIEDKKNEKF